MTKEELNQLNDLREEIRELGLKIADLNNRGSRIVTDRVTASSHEFPYIQTSVKITGYDYSLDKRTRKQIQKKTILLRQRKEEAEELEARITEFINGVEKSEIRRIMEYKYIEGKTWEEIGKIFHCDRTTAEKKVAAYLRSH